MNDPEAGGVRLKHGGLPNAPKQSIGRAALWILILEKPGPNSTEFAESAFQGERGVYG